MNRLAVLLAAFGTLGTGCVVSDNQNTCNLANYPTQTVAVSWPSFLFYDGSSASSGSQASRCAYANVDWIDVYMDDQRVLNPSAGTNGYWLCSDGGVNVTGVDNGSSHLVTVEGIDLTTSAISLRDEVTVSPACDVLVTTEPSEGTFRLDYRFADGGNCTAAGSEIWYSLTDDISGDVIAIDQSTPEAQMPLCGDVITFRLASGAYTVHTTEEAVPVTAGWSIAAGNCTPDPFSIAGASLTPVDRPLTGGVACP